MLVSAETFGLRATFTDLSTVEFSASVAISSSVLLECGNEEVMDLAELSYKNNLYL